MARIFAVYKISNEDLRGGIIIGVCVHMLVVGRYFSVVYTCTPPASARHAAL